MIPGFGKEQIFIGSAPDNDIVLAAPGVAPRHASVAKRGAALVFIDLGAGQSFGPAGPILANQPVPFDLRSPFTVGQVPVPLNHPSLTLMLMAQGQATAPRGHVVIGREAPRASLVIAHPAVSGHHATVMLDRMMVVDHGSTSGTYVNGKQCAAQQPVPIDPNGTLAFGPVTVSVPLLIQIEQALTGLQPMAPAPHVPHVQTTGNPVAAPPGPQQPQQPQPGEAPRKHRTVIGELSMAQLASSVIIIGRTPDNKIVVPHPQVSSKHAQIVKQGDQLFLEDLGSSNGTYVRGQRLVRGQRVPVQNGEKVFIGPMPLLIHIGDQQVNVVVEDVVEGQRNWAGKPLYEIEAWDLFLEVEDRDRKGEMKTLLDRVSFKALPGDMIALMGPSGAGKTTLLLTLNGYLPPSAGQVRVNGEDLYAIYDALRGSIGYVPQDDIVHPELTVFEAVKYSARFRLPPDYSEDEIDRRVEQTLRDLGLEGVMNLQIGKPEKKVLSGGQRKRVNIALELVTDPVILFLDEPTSGLAADDTTALINLLSELTSKTGKTIIMTIHQPAKEEFEKFTHTFIMGYGGIPVYFGPASEPAYKFFGSIQDRISSASGTKTIDNPRDMFDMLSVRERSMLEQLKRQYPQITRNQARLEAAKAWRAEFFNPQNTTYQKMYGGRREVGSQTAARGVPHRADIALVRQLVLLLSRYWKVKIRDVAGSAIMFLQAPIIGLMLFVVFGGQKHSIPFWCLGALQELSRKSEPGSASGTADLMSKMLPTPDHTVAMFFVVVSCVWFGTSNAAREIVTERAIYLRERMVNLSLVNYVFSKFLLLAFICVIQCTMLLGIVFFSLGFNGGPEAFFLELVSMVAVAINATALGLLVSTLVTSPDAAMALTPIALIPQVVLGGMMVPMTTNWSLKYLMYFMPARWGFQGAIAHERLAIAGLDPWNISLNNPSLNSPADYIYSGKFRCAMAQVGSERLQGAWAFTDWESWWIPWGVLSGMSLCMFALVLLIMKRRDPV